MHANVPCTSNLRYSTCLQVKAIFYMVTQLRCVLLAGSGT